MIVSFGSMLYTVLIAPLETAFEMIYMAAMKLVHHPGLSIIFLSMVMNILLLPLYRRTDAIQEEAIATEKKLKPFVSHIKKTFKGDERFMMLQTCYRQNHYKPTDAIKGVSPLLLEIPFFMAAYNFLSHLELLHNCALGPIHNLGAPDGLLVIGGVAINLLPILMTLINVLSSAIYTKGAPAKTKLQLYGMAALFLVLLYDSPAGLVFYWTLNNLFSLVKNALMKMKKPMLVLGCVATPASIAGLIYAGVSDPRMSTAKWAVVLLIALCMNVPLAMYLYKKNHVQKAPRQVVITSKNKLTFFGCAAVLTLLIGVTIPAALVNTSPEEFIHMDSAFTPNTYVLNTALMAAGFFLVWMGVFYVLATPQCKRVMEYVMAAVAAVAVVDYMVFGKHYGNLSDQLVFDEAIRNTIGSILINLVAIAAVAAVVYFIWKKKPDIIRLVSIAAVIAMIATSTMNIVQSQKVITEKMEQLAPAASPENENTAPVFKLSKTGKNVVVIMMDRAISSYLPYIFHEKPELKKQFAGFTYYPNTLSYGGFTNFGLPSVFGGYEYTPLEMNKRDQESLEKKHNESLKVMPVLFQNNGFQVTVNDPTYAGYDWIPDLSIFDEYPDMQVQITMGRYNKVVIDPANVLKQRFFLYSLFKTAPTFINRQLYDKGNYLTAGKEEEMQGQVCKNKLIATGRSGPFDKSYSVLKKLPELTQIVDDPQNTYHSMCNDTTHSPAILQMPNYVPQNHVDNTRFDKATPVRTNDKGETIVMKKTFQLQHYHCNVASYLQLGNWLDYLRKNDVYDNTRIIIVSDHGRGLGQIEKLKMPTGDIALYNPLLMVKDFNSHAFKTDDTFMTNADVPMLATAGLIQNPVNPFTGKPLIASDKTADKHYVIASDKWEINKNNGNRYLEDSWYEMKGSNVWDKNSWKPIEENDIPQ